MTAHYRKIIRKSIALAAVAAMIGSSLILTVSAGAGDLDPSFDLDGIAITDFGPDSSALTTAIQADGKTLAAGQIYGNQDTDFALARYNTSGSLDQSFGVGGLVTTDFGGYDSAYGIAIRPDGRIILAGGTFVEGSGGGNIALARYKVDGSLDTSFGSGGKVIYDLLVPVSVRAVALQSDGKIIVAGSISFSTYMTVVDFYVARFTSSGSLDTSFGGGDGFEFTDFSNPRDYLSAVVVQSDGKIVVAGGSNDEAGNSFDILNFDFCMARYNVNGGLDTSFGSGGKVVTQSFGKGSTEDLLLQPNGKLVLVASSKTNYADFALIRYNTNGSLDTSFGNGGFTRVDFDNGTYDKAEAAALQSDGKIVVVGQSDVIPDYSGLARFNADGSLDTSFGTNGIVTTDIAYFDHCTDVAIQADGRIVTSSWTQENVTEGDHTSIFHYFAVARYLDGSSPQPADLSINMTDSPDPVSLGQTLVYTITVTNNEVFYPKAAHVTLQETLPAGTDFISLQVPAGWVVYEKPAVGSTGKISCSAYALAAGQTAQFALAVRVRNAASGSTISNTAQVKSLTPDPNGANNKKTVVTTVN
jgi:uncharacterized delta-60 repeat protein/uncharacterized repeat protein (TIGR01451 family)